MRGEQKNLKFLMGPGWAKNLKFLMDPGWEKPEIFDGSVVGKKI
jgi:hypothetical protein